MKGRLLRVGLEVADALVGLLPSPVAYGLADLAGRAWHRFAPGRRRLVAANLARVCRATGRPDHGPAFDRLVREAFIAHARYYLEVVRIPRYDPADVNAFLELDDQAGVTDLMDANGVVAASAHFGNFEPGALWLADHGRRWMAPVERIEPPELFAYLDSRRGGHQRGGEIVTPPAAGRRALQTLRDRGLVAIAADRAVGDAPARTVTFFGHPARMPDGPATLALMTDSPVVVGTIRRTGRDRFAAFVERVEWTPSGDREVDRQELTQRITDRLAEHIGRHPDQWWGAFQPVWMDQPGAAEP